VTEAALWTVLIPKCERAMVIAQFPWRRIGLNGLHPRSFGIKQQSQIIIAFKGMQAVCGNSQ
jgi:hypothetical protein